MTCNNTSTSPRGQQPETRWAPNRTSSLWVPWPMPPEAAFETRGKPAFLDIQMCMLQLIDMYEIYSGNFIGYVWSKKLEAILYYCWAFSKESNYIYLYIYIYNKMQDKKTWAYIMPLVTCALFGCYHSLILKYVFILGCLTPTQHPPWRPCGKAAGSNACHACASTTNASWRDSDWVGLEEDLSFSNCVSSKSCAPKDLLVIRTCWNKNLQSIWGPFWKVLDWKPFFIFLYDLILE